MQKRWLSSWDGSPGAKSLPITEAPTLGDINSRCRLDDKPPTLRVPSLPARISRATNLIVECRFPHHPTARLGIAVLLKKLQRLAYADLIVSTAFLHALAGDLGKTREKFFLQWHGQTLCSGFDPTLRCNAQPHPVHALHTPTPPHPFARLHQHNHPPTHTQVRCLTRYVQCT